MKISGRKEKSTEKDIIMQDNYVKELSTLYLIQCLTNGNLKYFVCFIMHGGEKKDKKTNMYFFFYTDSQFAHQFLFFKSGSL